MAANGTRAVGWRRRLRTSRLRIVAWLMLLVFVVLALTIAVTRQLLIADVNERIDSELRGDVAELRLLADIGIDPTTGEPFADAEALVLVSLEKSIPDRYEAMFVIIDGAVIARSRGTPPARVDLDQAFVDSVAGVTTTRYGEAPTASGSFRYVAIPVSEGSGTGSGAVLVVGVFADLEAAGVVRVTRILIAVSLVTLAAAAVLGWVIAGRVLAPLRDLRDTARSITETDLHRRIPVAPEPTGDELDDLSRTVNDMLDRVEAGYVAQRTFIDDAGHELRTPITVARGHLETMDDDPDSVAATRALVLDELERMSRLVHDLQTLTKAQSAGFVRPERVDVEALVDDLLVKCSALAPRRWSIDEQAHGILMLDRQRITQAVLQLADNAVRHTSPSDTIALGSRIAYGTLQLWVRDTGPGVAPSDRDRIFERFQHGHRSEGAGLGLAIVGAIAQGHGGSVSVEDAPGGGALFRLDVPARPEVEP